MIGVWCKWIVKRGSKGVWSLWSVAGLAKAEKRKARADKTKGSKRYVIARGCWMNDLDTEVKFLVYAFPQSSSASINFLATSINHPHVVATPSLRWGDTHAL